MLDNPYINYGLIADAEAYYKEAGFRRILVPWAVSQKAIEITAPIGTRLYPYNCKAKDVTFLVASGEQSLLQEVINDNFLKSCDLLDLQTHDVFPGKALAITPCFRKETRIDRFTRPYFLKVELFDNNDPTEESLDEIIQLCLKWFSRHIQCKIIKTYAFDAECASGHLASSPAYDIVSFSGIELGSYGIRQHSSVGKWIYATGCAEPRLSTAILHES